MALLDLASVTRSFMKLLAENINQSYYDELMPVVTVTAQAPDKVGAVDNTLSVFLYHVAEDPYYKNFEGPGSGDRNIARTPMALCLYYILTPHHEGGDPEDNPLFQQTLMGYALKTLHDYPIVTDDTTIGGVAILHEDMDDSHNPIQIILRPVGPEDALAFWGSEDQQTARLAAYYEVRVILLEPDEPTTVVAPVLSLGTYLYQLGTPHLQGSSSQLPFTLPTSAGGSSQLVTLTPARVSTDPGENPPHNQLELVGHNLAGGQARQLWLRNAAFTTGPLPIDLALTNNTDNGWAMTVSDGKLVLDLSETLYYLDDNDDEQSITLLPGIYTTFLRVQMSERMVADQLVPITNDSNEIALVVIPRIASATPDGGTNKVDVSIVTTFELNEPTLELRLYVDGQAYTQNTGTAVAGEYEVLGETTLRFHALFDVEVTGEHPIRLVVNGAESAPYWVETSAP